ncbi:MAG: ATP-binding protein [Hyphomicrobiales bacterium]|nr:ATP-binding protein [Hyphomicrobiales bacterium]
MVEKEVAVAEQADGRRDARHHHRNSALVVSISGAHASVAAKMSDFTAEEGQLWSIGELVAIYGAKSRVICLVQDMASMNQRWERGVENFVQANVEILGEVTDVDGRPSFRRGVANYPALGSSVSRIRQSDFAAIYDLGHRKGSPVGQLVQAQIPASVDIETMLRRHFAVVGTTGVGKSSALSILVRRAIEERPNLRVVILDPHNEYSNAFRAEASTVEARRFELPFWLFQFEEFLEVIFRGAQAPADEADILREAIEESRESYSGGERAATLIKKTYRGDDQSSDAARPYRINDVLALIEAEIGKLEPRYSRFSLRSLKARLESISRDPNFRFMFGKAAVEAQCEFVPRSLFRISDAQKPVTILRMAGIPSDVVNASVSVLARLAFDLCVQQRGKQELLLVCEEAHRYVPADLALGFAPARRAIARIAKEGRKYGCYLSVVTQRPAELDPTILSQCSTVFAMRLSNAADQAILRSAIPDNAAGALAFIAALNNREAIAFGEAVATAMRLVFTREDETRLPRMVAEWEEGEPAVPASATDHPGLLEPITAPGYSARPAPRPVDPSFGTRDWPSSEHAVAGLRRSY